MTKVVVYGTLKSGYGNNRLLEKHNKVGNCVVSGFKLFYSWGKGSFPVAQPSQNDSIRGEIWDIENNEETLRRLDGLEGEGYMYIRTPIEAVTDDGEVIEAQMYVGGPRAWDFSEMQECPLNPESQYEWGRNQSPEE